MNQKKDELIRQAKDLGVTTSAKMTKKDILALIDSAKKSANEFPVRLINKHIKYIVHIADVHIRDSKRHDEFQAVFDQVTKFVEKLWTEKNNNNNIDEDILIIFAGDIFDEAAKRTPSVESMIIIRNWFKLLANFGLIVVFPGNHDCREANTSILEGLLIVTTDIPNLIYLRESQHLVFDNLNLTHSSLIDKKFIYSPPGNYVRRSNFAIYHGAMNTISAGHSSRFRRESDFANFGFVLLGDIHIRDTWEVENEDAGGGDSKITTFAYPGSLLQQNHGEEFFGHGFLIWKENEDGIFKDNFVEVKNNYAHVTITDENIPPNLIAENLYLRILNGAENLNISEIFAGKKIIETNYVTKKIDSFVPPKPITAGGKIESIVEECIGKNDLAKFHQIDQNTINFGKHSADIPSQCSWTIKLLNVSGIFAFGSPISLDLRSGITLISGRNGSGKTSLINALRYTLLHKADGTKDTIKNKFVQSYLANCIFEVDGTEYEITDQNGSFINFVSTGGKKLNQGQITATYRQVENFIGTDWLSNCIFSFDRENFLQYSPQKRLTEIKSADFALSLWMSYENRAKELLRTAKNKQLTLTGKFSSYQYFDTSAKIAEYTRLCDCANSIIINTMVSHLPRDTSEAYLAKCRATPMPPCEFDENYVSELSRKLANLNEKYYSIKLSDAEKNIISSTATVDTYKLEERLAELADINQNENFDYQINKLNSTISSLKRTSPAKIDNEDLLIPKDKCLLRQETKIPTRRARSVEEVREEIDAAKNHSMSGSEITKLKNEVIVRANTGNSNIVTVQRDFLHKIIRALTSLESPIDTAPLYNEISQIEKYNEAVLQNKLDVEHNIAVKKSLSHYSHIELSTAEIDLKTLKEKSERAKLKSRLLSAKNRRELVQRLEEQQELEMEINSIRREISEQQKLKTSWTTYENAFREAESILVARQLNQKRDFEMAANKLHAEIETAETMNKQREETENQLETVKREISDLEFYISSCKKITTKLLLTKISVISDFVNQFLHGLVPFEVRLRLVGDDKIEIEFKNENTILSVGCLSGYQSFLYNLVFAAALNKYCAAKSAKFLFIDECISMADNENINLLPTLFNRLRSVYDSIIIISHLPSIAEYVDRHLRIEVGENGKRNLKTIS